MRYLLLFMACFLSSSALCANKDVANQIKSRFNLIDNAGAENNKAGMTASTPAQLTVTTVNPIRGKASFVFDAAASPDSLSTIKFPVPVELQGEDCSVGFDFINAAAGSNRLKYVVRDDLGVDVFTSITLNTSGASSLRSIRKTFTCPSDAVQLVIFATSSDPVAITLDNLWLGSDVEMGLDVYDNFCDYGNVCGVALQIPYANGSRINMGSDPTAGTSPIIRVGRVITFGFMVSVSNITLTANDWSVQYVLPSILGTIQNSTCSGALGNFTFNKYPAIVSNSGLLANRILISGNTAGSTSGTYYGTVVCQVD